MCSTAIQYTFRQARLLYAISRIDKVSMQNRYRIVESILVSIQPNYSNQKSPPLRKTMAFFKLATFKELI
jgi:hypothetical protein